MFGFIALASLRPIIRHRPCLTHGQSRPARWRAKLRVSVLNIGRHSSKDAAFDGVVDEYVKRLRPVMDVDTRWIKPDAAVAAVLDAAQSGTAVLCLDAKGMVLRSSEHFAELLYSRLESGGSRLCFVVGDADGLPDELKPGALGLRSRPNVEHVSLSNLTLTHKMVRHFAEVVCPTFLYCRLACGQDWRGGRARTRRALRTHRVSLGSTQCI
jgi:23S rRNA pseudoU1915 N3-methylase RlmH